MQTLREINKKYVQFTLQASIKGGKGLFVPPSPRRISYGDLTNILRQNGLNILETHEDLAFFTTKFESFTEFFDTILTPILPLVPYIPEKRDCDNFANMVMAFTALFMELNTMGKVHCKVYDATTGALVAGHFCNLFVTQDNEVYFYDFNNAGRYAKYEGKDLVMGNWRYTAIDRVVFG